MSLQEEAPSVEERFIGLLDNGEQPEAPVENAGQAETEEVEVEEGLEPEGEELEAASEESSEDAEEEAEDTETSQDPSNEFIEFTLDNGEQVKVTADEYKGHYLRQADYTRKTQELAEQRKSFDAERQQAEAYIHNQMQQLQEVLAQEEEPNWDLIYENDPLNAPKIERDYRAKQTQKQQLLAQQQQQIEYRRQQVLTEQAQQLPQMIPHWTDPKVAEKETVELRNALLADGFDPSDVANVSDARLVKWLLAGHRQMQLESNATKVVKKKVAGKPKVNKVGSAPVKASKKSEAVQKRKAAQNSQSDEAWSNVFEDFV